MTDLSYFTANFGFYYEGVNNSMSNTLLLSLYVLRDFCSACIKVKLVYLVPRRLTVM